MSDRGSHPAHISWPQKYNLWGVNVSATTYDELLNRVLQAVARNLPATVDHMPVHGLVEAVRDISLRDALNAFTVVAPDGQPVRWALKTFHGVRLPDRVYGPEFMKRLCGSAAREGHAVYLYGGSASVIAKLKARLVEMFPRLMVVGHESPPYRDLTPEEDDGTVRRINGSGAQIVFLGLGCPKQEIFAYRHRNSIEGVQVCVGAAFDFLSGEKRMAPRWMQDRGLEWLFRFLAEPGRLHKRYVQTNSIFLWLVARDLWRLRLKRVFARKPKRDPSGPGE